MGAGTQDLTMPARRIGLHALVVSRRCLRERVLA
jgi:hypothetical protein